MSALLLANLCGLKAQTASEDLLAFLKGKDPLVDQVMENRLKYRLQFLVSGIVRTADQLVRFEDYDYSDSSYFYPASLVKLPAALISLEILDSLRIPLEARIRMNDDAGCGNTPFRKLTQNKSLTFRELTEEMITISNNPYFSLLFHFAGPEELNGRMLRKNFHHTRIYSAYSSCPKRADVKTSSYRIMDAEGKEILSVPVRLFPYNSFRDQWPRQTRKIFLQNKGSSRPVDFNDYHEYSLSDIHGTMKRLIFPGNFPPAERFQLSPNSRNFLLRCLGKYPQEMMNPAYQKPGLFPDNFYKYCIIGEEAGLVSPDKFRIISKIGLSFGFVTETAYVLDFDSGKDFLFSVSMYAPDERMPGGGNYAYEKLARPFIARISRLILEFLHLQLPEERCPEPEINAMKKLFTE